MLRFLIQSNVVVFPKSVHKERMVENFNIFDFSLSQENMNTIRKMDTGQSAFFDHRTAEAAEMFMKWF